MAAKSKIGRTPNGTGLAGAEAPEPHSRLGPSDGIPCASLFGQAVDALARKAGSWPEDAIPYAAEVLGGGDNPQILLTGRIPVGARKNGAPKFDRKSREYKAAVPLSEYRAALKSEQVTA